MSASRHPRLDTVSTYLKITDRAAWTHAEVSVAVVLQVEGPRIQTVSVVWAAWRRCRGACPRSNSGCTGQALSATVAGQAGALAIAHAQPLAKNGHKVPMTSAAVERALLRSVPV